MILHLVITYSIFILFSHYGTSKVLYTTEKYNGKRLNTSLNIGVIFKSTRIKNKTSMIAHMTRLFLKR